MQLFEYLKLAKISLFRFEYLQEYKSDINGMNDSKMKEWWSFIESKTKSGVVMQRVRLVIEPLNDYTKKEIEIHKKSNNYGDNIKIIKNKEFKKLKIKLKDFWLIDEKIVLKMKYLNNGEYLGFDVIDKNIEDYVKISKILFKNSSDIK